MKAQEASYGNALEPGHRLQWYRIERVLGQGSFGITYLARDTNLDQLVAIKEYLPLELAGRARDGSVGPLSPEKEEQFRWGLERFISEARTLARFDHPGIVRVRAVFETNGSACMVMPYEEGATLAQVLKTRTTLEEAEVLRLLQPILDGLETVHAAGFIHRDVKPGNILLRRDKSPVLIDFGSARQALEQQSRTLTGLASPGYAPIEQYSSRSDEQGPWSDIYGLAATLYRCVTGVAPSEAIERSQCVLAHAPDPMIAAADAASRRYSPALLGAIDRGLAFRAADRPRSIAAWRRDFEAAAAAPPPPAPTPAPDTDTPPTVPLEPAPRTRRRAAEAAPAIDPEARTVLGPGARRRRRRGAIALGVTALGLALAAWLLRDAPTPSPPAPAPPAPAVARGPAAADSGDPAAGPAPQAAAGLRDVQPPTEHLLALAEQALADFRLTTPAGSSARDYYRRVLDRDPGNAEAQLGLAEIARRYALLAEQRMQQGQYAAAREYVARGLEVQPGDTRLRVLRDDLDARRAARRRAAREAGPGGSVVDRVEATLDRFFESDPDAPSLQRTDK